MAKWHKVPNFPIALKRELLDSAKEFGADDKLTAATLTIFAGMWTRNPVVVAKMIQAGPGIDVQLLCQRCVSLGIWADDGGVYLCDPKTELSDLDIWLRAMAVNGDIAFDCATHTFRSAGIR